MENVDILEIKSTLDEIIEKYEIEADISRYAKKYVDALMVAKEALKVVERHDLMNEIFNEFTGNVTDEQKLMLEDEIRRKMEELKSE